jgi:hypothetical protein
LPFAALAVGRDGCRRSLPGDSSAIRVQNLVMTANIRLLGSLTSPVTASRDIAITDVAVYNDVNDAPLTSERRGKRTEGQGMGISHIGDDLSHFGQDRLHHLTGSI